MSLDKYAEKIDNLQQLGESVRGGFMVDSATCSLDDSYDVS